MEAETHKTVSVQNYRQMGKNGCHAEEVELHLKIVLTTLSKIFPARVL